MFCNKPAQKLLSSLDQSKKKDDFQNHIGSLGERRSISVIQNQGSNKSKNNSFSSVDESAQLLCFVPLYKNAKKNNFESIGSEECLSLHEIVETQAGQANQKKYIYRVEINQLTTEMIGIDSAQSMRKFYQVRVKNINFLGKSATAIYFYDFSNQIKTLQLSTELLVKEKQNQSLNLSQMTLSHEFRTPLSSTLMMLESLLRGIADEAQRHIVFMIISQMNLLLCLVNDILDLKMIDQDRFITRSELFNPNVTFKFVSNIFKKQAEMMDAPLIFETVQKLRSPEIVGPDDRELFDDELAPLPQQLIGDHLRLKQVLVNLVKNALKFSYGKPVRIKSCYNGREKKLEVHVVDMGRGIKPENMKKLFQVFGKIDEQPDEFNVNTEGIGLGLTICKKIVENSGGKIDCYSAGEGQGSVFMFSMKMTLPEKNIINASNKSERKHSQELSAAT